MLLFFRACSHYLILLRYRNAYLLTYLLTETEPIKFPFAISNIAENKTSMSVFLRHFGLCSMQSC